MCPHLEDTPNLRKKVLFKELLQEVPYPFKHKFILTEKDKCAGGNVDLMILVKSRVKNAQHRKVIRETWANENRSKREQNIVTKTIFVIGSCDSIPHCNEDIELESKQYHDIVQVDFVDTYFNLTIKTHARFKWLVDYCPQAMFAIFSDDDFYISMKNLWNYLMNPVGHRLTRGFIPFDGRLFTGFVMSGQPPIRDPKSKYFVSETDYPDKKYPNYISGGAFILSNRAFHDLQRGMQLVKPFNVDDAYLGVLAREFNITLLHSPRFMHWGLWKTVPEKDVIALHCIGDYRYCRRFWKEQEQKGNA
jgi:hypothetical protein